ncbi:hypothetical protein ASPZODRAFT_16096 [Penicilliopsis zonata CBS 506.65]|uniref:Uncharacterized protein n=1 Tax=Penicilliopsis zonata CBS 506.65 TaxID=1073090 RepID=A0A1L9SJZ9_9EURO|nr:hypothetical protein ASPZODRAFT_16096 [Penicilliopsis zonata CBS 506.65]OJJ47416.1 hypothetical protein ASPZODRAFT_16096 [Penicilliopsis zonata CBS 506.65]
MPSPTGPSVDTGGLFTRIGNADETIYAVAYRYAFIRPDNPHDEVFQKFLPAETFIFDVARGNTAPRRIVVVADELVFIGGFNYDFSGHDMTIRCRKLHFFPVEGDNKPAIINVSGLPADKKNGPEGADGGKGGDGIIYSYCYERDTTWYFRQFTRRKTLALNADEARHPGSTGEDGKPGGAGSPGHPGGTFQLSFKRIDAGTTSNGGPCFHIVANGGEGGDGGKGGSGGSGGNGAVFNYDNTADNFTVWERIPEAWAEVIPGGNGGNGGPGGAGGAGGDGGAIKIYIPQTDGEDRQAMEALFRLTASKGQHGTPGDPGQGGGGGVYSNMPDRFYLDLSQCWNNVSPQSTAIYNALKDFRNSSWYGSHDRNKLQPLNGSSGNAAAATTAYNEGIDGSTKFETLDGAYEPAFANDTFFLSSLINRLYFKAHNIFSSQRYLPAKTPPPLDPKTFQGSDSEMMILNAHRDYYQVYN